MRLLQDLARAASRRGRPMVGVFFGSPYVTASVPEVPAMLLTYDFSDVAEASAVKALAGEIPLGGRLPIAIPGPLSSRPRADTLERSTGGSKHGGFKARGVQSTGVRSTGGSKHEGFKARWVQSTRVRSTEGSKHGGFKARRVKDRRVQSTDGSSTVGSKHGGANHNGCESRGVARAHKPPRDKPQGACAKIEVFAPLAQLDRASGYEPGGRTFESCRAHHSLPADWLITVTTSCLEVLGS